MAYASLNIFKAPNFPEPAWIDGKRGAQINVNHSREGTSGYHVRPSAGKGLCSLWSHRHRHDLCSMPRISVFSPYTLQDLPKNHRLKNGSLTVCFTTSAARLRAIAAGYRDLERKFSRAHRLALKDGHLIMLNISTIHRVTNSVISHTST